MWGKHVLGGQRCRTGGRTAFPAKLLRVITRSLKQVSLFKQGATRETPPEGVRHFKQSSRQLCACPLTSQNPPQGAGNGHSAPLLLTPVIFSLAPEHDSLLADCKYSHFEFLQLHRFIASWEIDLHDTPIIERILLQTPGSNPVCVTACAFGRAENFCTVLLTLGFNAVSCGCVPDSLPAISWGVLNPVHPHSPCLRAGCSGAAGSWGKTQETKRRTRQPGGIPVAAALAAFPCPRSAFPLGPLGAHQRQQFRDDSEIPAIKRHLGDLLVSSPETAPLSSYFRTA